MKIDRPLKIFLIISIGFFTIIGLVWYAILENATQRTENLFVLDPNDPMVIEAQERAIATLDTLFKLYPSHTESSYVRFPYTWNDGITEQTWSKIILLERDHVAVQIEKRVEDYNSSKYINYQVPLEKINDWTIELENGKIRGGFTNQARLKLETQSGVDENSEPDKGLARFVDKL